ncbi:hypothetical protein B6N60_03973 [Richelia sinica FACHB-800]|uniref:KAP NTPase domain-containing protein n=1 Tax=Richelia sinica FACHB-800 TaxID=1357546 RepID=A0A975Y6H4_9NOST|nr:ATP-binding protein [Richelia sinica]MBD2666643.1 ATP-binding protein [Richelia sinica FACHB-800]QXE25259.1 hypothetical protein B6N60_03973 [Richelia sinica FACHB-800]
MKLDFARFFKACNPAKTLVMGQAEDRQYYIDFSEVRGARIIEELKRTITRLSPEDPTCQLFTGHIGCGKSTELLRLKTELEQQDFHVVYFESNQSLDMADVDVTDILLAIAREVSQSLEGVKINLHPGYFQNLFTEVASFLQTPIELGVEAELSVGIGKITAKTKDSPNLRSQLRQHLEPRTRNILDSINQELLKPAREKLKLQGKKGLVVIIDNLDRIDNAPKPNGQYQPEYLFVERGDQLKNLNCHVVYTIPLVLIYSNALARLNNRFGVSPKVLPMVAVQQRDGSDFSLGITLLQNMIMARAFPGENWQGTTELIGEVFDNQETLERLCKVSGGHLRNLLSLLYSCLQQDDPPISRDCLERVIKKESNSLTRAIDNDEWQLLQQVWQRKSIQGHEEYESLIRDLFVFEYIDEDGSWFDINPLLQESPKFRL